MDGNLSLARVRDRSIGVLFFSIFGALWLLIGFVALGLLTNGLGLALFLFTVGLIATACHLLRAVPKSVEPDPQRQRDGRMFLWVNVVQGLAISLVFQLAHHLHHLNAAFDVTVLIVGLHMFALPRSYRIASNLLTGGLLVCASVLCPLLFRGDMMVGAVTLCAGLTLWCSALWKLKSAVVFLRTAQLGC